MNDNHCVEWNCMSCKTQVFVAVENVSSQSLNQFQLTDRGASETTRLPVNLFRDLLTLTCGVACLCAYDYTWFNRHSCMYFSVHLPFNLWAPAKREEMKVNKVWCQQQDLLLKAMSINDLADAICFKPMSSLITFQYSDWHKGKITTMWSLSM